MINIHPSTIFLPDNVNSTDLEKIYLILRNNEFLSSSNGLMFISADELKWSGMTITQEVFLGFADNKACYVVELTDESPLMDETYLSNMRSLLGSIPDNLFTICSRSLQLIEWLNAHQFCGLCGSQMQLHTKERAMECTCTKILVYPKISPCVIVLVTKGNELLLAHNKNFPGKFYSTLAGFIEAGESVESAIHREIKEEVNIEVKNISYFGSQSWPFPGQLMLGFHAEYLSGEIVPDGEEIDEADWFNPHDLPSVPSGKISISGRLIEDFLNRVET